MTEYDHESMGGIMGQILSLTAPPGLRNGVQNAYNGPSNTFGLSTETGLAAHPYFRRPGKGHNRDSCDACSEGGDLICCDICPASFHLTCHDPPLDEETIPMGEWMCHQCRIKREDDKLPNNRNGKTIKTPKGKEKDDEAVNVWTSGRQMEVSKTALTVLVMDAASSNPKQFSLPYELTLPANFPYEPKDTCRRNGRRGWGRKKRYELDNGITPRPAILCFQCSKSCRVGIMIPCDFCNLHYHLDCVNPPLTIPPTGKWMCPAHPEHFADANLDSHSLVQRVKLWSKFSGPVDDHTVKINFTRKCNRERVNSKFRSNVVTRSCVKVPSGVKWQYAHPSELLPHLSSSAFVPMPTPVKTQDGIAALLEASYLIEKNEPELKIETDQLEAPIENGQSAHLPHIVPTPEERTDWLNGIVKLQSDLTGESEQVTAPDYAKLMNGVDSTQPHVNGHLPQQSCATPTKSKSRRRKMYPYRNHRISQYQNQTAYLAECLSSLSSTLKSNIEKKLNIKINSLDQSLMETLAYERMLMFSKAEPEKKALKVPDIPARALLCPLEENYDLKFMFATDNYLKDPVPMKFRVMNIGIGSQNHLNLENFGHCNFISPQQAVILFDQNTGKYELINYSKYGTTVDGTTLSCNYTQKTVSEAGIPPLVTQLRFMADCNRGVKPHADDELDIPAMNSIPGQTIVHCKCVRFWKSGSRVKSRLDTTTISGWEGPTILNHGSFIKFGCINFVFSVVETAMHGVWTKDVFDNYNKFIVKDRPDSPTVQKS